MDAGYWGRVAAVLVAHPTETVARVRQRFELRRFAGDPVDYGADPAWERTLGARLPAPEPDAEGWRAVVESLRGELPDFPYGHDADAALGRSIWRIARAVRPERVVETGVARGVTSRFALAALTANGGGRLWSVDLPPILAGFHSSVGAAVPADLRGRWTYIRGSSRSRLPGLLRELAPIDLFIQDSLGTEPTMRFELEQAWRALRPGGWIVVSGVSRGAGFGRFLAELGVPATSIVAESESKPSAAAGEVVHGQFALVEKPVATPSSAGAPRGLDRAAV